MSRNNHLTGGLFAAAKPVPLTIRETSLSAQIAEYLDTRRVYNDRLNCGRVETRSGNYFYGCKTGTPDRFCIIRGRIVFIEVKRLGGALSPEQRAKHEELCTHGAIVLVCDSFEVFVGKFTAIRAALEAFTARKGELYD